MSLARRIFCFGIMVALGYGWAVPAQDSPMDAAQKIMAHGRDAVGGEAKLKAVQSLSYSGKALQQVRMMMNPGGEGAAQPPPTTIENNFEVDIQAPDKYVRRDTREVANGAATIITHSGFNGDKPILHVETIGDLPFNPNQMMQGGDPAVRLRGNKQNFLRAWLGFAFEVPAGYGLAFRSVGTESINNVTYDVVETIGPENFAAKLFYDAASHRLTMIRFRGPFGRQSVRMGGPPPGQGPGGTPPAGASPAGDGPQTRVLQRPAGPAPEVDVEISFSDFKAVDGIQLPHKIRRAVNGEVNEETEIKKYKINSNPKADKFKVE